jgi:5-methylcytosine-specific restriction endonuclease McrA
MAYSNAGGQNRKYCPDCRRLRNRDINSRHFNSRRANGTPLTITELADRDGRKCHICRRKIDLNLPGSHRFGPTIEHILPISKGGNNDPANLALAHRKCNVSRGNRGSSQMLIEIDYARSTA